jgi:hypothetical protein
MDSMTKDRTDAVARLFGSWKLLRWPGMPPREPDWSDVETAFRAGYYQGQADAAEMTVTRLPHFTVSTTDGDRR